jgi:clan AA aspartic protease (TIGR02281 family)
MKRLGFLWLLVLQGILLMAQSYNFEEGKKAIDDNDYPKAIDFFTRDLKDNPRSALTYLYRAYAYYNSDDNASALRDANQGLKVVTSKQKVLKADLLQVRARVYNQIDEVDLALADYAAAIKLNKKDETFYSERAQIYFELDNYEKSNADYRALLKLDETDVRAMVGLARNFTYLEKFAEADKLLDKVIKLKPDYDSGYYFKALSMYRQGKYNAAIEAAMKATELDIDDERNRERLIEYAEKNIDLTFSLLNKAISENEDVILWYLIRGALLQDHKHYMLALKDFTKLITMVEAEVVPAIYRIRAACFAQFGMNAEAVSDFDEMLKVLEKDAQGFYVRAHYKDALGDVEGAMADLNKALEITPTDAEMLAARGWLYESAFKNNDAALKDYNQALSFNKDFTRALMYRGRLYAYKLNDTEKAKADFNKVLETDTTYDNHRSIRHFALLELKKKDEAAAWMDKIVATDPDYEYHHYNAACLYSLMNDPEKAIASLKTAFEKGYCNMEHLDRDVDFDNLRDHTGFINVVETRRQELEKAHQEWRNQKQVPLQEQKAGPAQVTVPMIQKGSGVYEVACKINDLPLNFIFDTGASDISISQTEVQFMLKNNYMAQRDIKGSQRYMDANGNIEVGTRIILRKVEIGEFVLHNVVASVVNNRVAPLLIGQSALAKYGKILIDNESKTITLSR